MQQESLREEQRSLTHQGPGLWVAQRLPLFMWEVRLHRDHQKCHQSQHFQPRRKTQQTETLQSQHETASSTSNQKNSHVCSARECSLLLACLCCSKAHWPCFYTQPYMNNSHLLANCHFFFTQRISGWTLSAIIDIINLPYSVIMAPLETYNSE